MRTLSEIIYLPLTKRFTDFRRQALAASRPEQAELLIDLVISDDEDDDLDAPVHIKDSDLSRLRILKKDGGPGTQDVTRLSKLENGAKSNAVSSIKDQPTERSPRMKRKAEGELRLHGVKRSSSTSLAMNMSSARSSGSTPRACKFQLWFILVYLS
jgi:hypothetical protein